MHIFITPIGAFPLAQPPAGFCLSHFLFQGADLSDRVSQANKFLGCPHPWMSGATDTIFCACEKHYELELVISIVTIKTKVCIGFIERTRNTHCYPFNHLCAISVRLVRRTHNWLVIFAFSQLFRSDNLSNCLQAPSHGVDQGILQFF